MARVVVGACCRLDGGLSTRSPAGVHSSYLCLPKKTASCSCALQACIVDAPGSGAGAPDAAGFLSSEPFLPGLCGNLFYPSCGICFICLHLHL